MVLLKEGLFSFMKSAMSKGKGHRRVFLSVATADDQGLNYSLPETFGMSAT